MKIFHYQLVYLKFYGFSIYNYFWYYVIMIYYIPIGYYSSLAILLIVTIDIASVVIDRRSTTVGYDKDYNDNINVLGMN